MTRPLSCSLPFRLFKLSDVYFYPNATFSLSNTCCYSCTTQFYTNSLISSIVAAIRTCYSLSHCGSLHARVIKSLHYRDGFIGDQLVSKYVELGCIGYANNLFDEIPNRDIASWNSLISAFSRSGYPGMCLDSFSRVRREMGVGLNEVTLIAAISGCAEGRVSGLGGFFHGLVVKIGMLLEIKVVNCLINVYGKCGDLDASCSLFEEMPVKSLVSWNSIVGIHVENGLAVEGMGYVNRMRRCRNHMDDTTVLALLLACENIGSLRCAEAIHCVIVGYGFEENVLVMTALVNLYAKVGRLDASKNVFNQMTYPDRVAWSALLAGYAVHGYGREAIMLFDLMVKRGLSPDHVTFIHLLSACSHSGLVEEGKRHFEMMFEVYAINPSLDHYSCMVDLFGRAGLLEDAYQLIESMPMEPNSGVWGAFLNACRVHKNINLGKEVAERLISLDSSDRRNYIMLSNMYSTAGLWGDASKIRALMNEKCVAKVPGISWIEHENKIHKFVVGDRSHPQSEMIYVKLEEMIRKIRETGLAPQTEFVLHDVNEEVKEEQVNQHSEKLAIAFGLLVTKPGRTLIIIKNLRICGDCHSTIKLVSMIEKRTIIVRDSKRFHHFSQGRCSCGDYW